METKLCLNKIRMKEVRKDDVMNFNFFIDRLKSYFQYQENYSNQVYLQETEMNKKFHIRKRMFLNDDFDLPAFVIAVVEDTSDLQTTGKDEFHYGNIDLTLSDCNRQISYHFCLYNAESRANSLNKIKRLAETINEFRDALEKEIEMIEKLKGNKTKAANA